MNLLNHESKMKLFNDKLANNPNVGPQWSQNISDLVKKNHQSKFQLNQMQSNTDNQYSNNRLVQKLVNIHHQTSYDQQQPAQGIKLSKTVVGPLNQRDLQKRIALEDCTNFMQQKTLNQGYPTSSTSQTINNIMNSNRSGNSSSNPSFITLKTNGGAGSGKSAVGQFKFNLTLNRNKMANQQNQEYNAFYPQQQQIVEENTQDLLAEDSEAMMIVQNRGKVQPRGKSALGQRQHSKFMLVKTYDQQQQLENQDDNFLDYPNDQHDFKDLKRQSHSQNSRNHGVKKMKTEKDQFLTDTTNPLVGDTELEERQKIFEDEIIKRVKEIQKYAKSLHLQIKKIQSSQGKRNEEWKEIKDQLLQVKEEVNKDEFNEAVIQDIINKRFQIQDNEIENILQNQETKMTKDLDVKIQKTNKSILSDVHQKLDAQREDLLTYLQEDFSKSLKQDFVKLISDKLSQNQKLTDKLLSDFKLTLQHLTTDFEDFKESQAISQKDQGVKFDRLQKQMRDERETMNDQISHIQENISEEMDMMKKKIIKEFKNEFDVKQFATQTDLNDQLTQFNAKISMMADQLQKKSENSINSEMPQIKSQIVQMQEKIQVLDNSQVAYLNKLSIMERQMQETLDLESIRQNLDLHSEQIQNVQALIDNNTEDEQNNKKEITNLTSIITRIQSSTQQIDVIKQQANQAFDKAENLSQQVESLDSDLSKSHQSLNMKIQQLQSDFNSNNQDFKQSLDNQLNSLSLDFASKFESHDVQIQNLKTEVVQQQEYHHQQKPSQLDEDQLTESVMLQMDPKLSQMKAQLSQLTEQMDYLKQQMTQKMQRSELQEVKAQIDDQISNFKKNSKKQEEKVNQSEAKIQEIEEKVGLQESIINERIDSQMQEFKDEIQYKLEEIDDKLSQRQETPTKDQNTNQIDQAQVENIIREYVSPYEKLNNTLQQQIEQLEAQVQDLSSSLEDQKYDQDGKLDTLQESLDLKIQSLNQSLQLNIQTFLQQGLQDFQQSFTPTIQSQPLVNDNLKHQQEQLTEELRSQNSFTQDRINELENRLTNLFSENQEQLQELQSLIEETEKQVQNLKSEEKPKDYGQDIHHIQENIQNIMIENSQSQDKTNKEFQLVKDLIQTQMTSSQHQDNQIKIQLESLQQSISEQMIDVKNSQEQIALISKKQSLTESQLALLNNEFSTSLEQAVQAFEKKFIDLEGKISTAQLASPKAIPQIKVTNLQESNNLMHPGLEVSNINSCRSHQNFLGSAQKRQDHKDLLQNEFSQNHQVHFLEDLSEADMSNCSQHKYTNQTDDGDMLMFNNKTQSLGSSQVMNGKLQSILSQVDGTKQQFTFNHHVSNRLVQLQSENFATNTGYQTQQQPELIEENDLDQTQNQECQQLQMTEEEPAPLEESSKQQYISQLDLNQYSQVQNNLHEQQFDQSNEQSPVSSQKQIVSSLQYPQQEQDEEEDNQQEFEEEEQEDNQQEFEEEEEEDIQVQDQIKQQTNDDQFTESKLQESEEEDYDQDPFEQHEDDEQQDEQDQDSEQEPQQDQFHLFDELEEVPQQQVFEEEHHQFYQSQLFDPNQLTSAIRAPQGYPDFEDEEDLELEQEDQENIDNQSYQEPEITNYIIDQHQIDDEEQENNEDSSQLHQEQPDYYANEDQNQEQFFEQPDVFEDEDEEEYYDELNVTPNKCTEMLTDWLLGQELAYCLDELQTLQEREFH